MKLILASSSPRRSEILEQVGIDFTVFKPKEDAENPLPSSKCADCADIAVENALLKAKWTSQYLDKDCLILSADTIVVSDGNILGKPIDSNDAKRMLKTLSGQEHQVITGVAIIDNSNDKMAKGHEVTDVFIKNLSDFEIDSYIKTGEPMDKAGAYAIQNRGALFIKSIRGCYFNVVGLPVFRMITLIKEIRPEFNSL